MVFEQGLDMGDSFIINAGVLMDFIPGEIRSVKAF
jgi:hypothetical protein